MLTEEERARAATQRAAKTADTARRRASMRLAWVEPPADWLGWAEVAAYLGVSGARVTALRKAGKLRGLQRRTRAWAYDPAAVAALRADRAARGVGQG